MALTKCKECGNEVSTKATSCPKCGAKQVHTSLFTKIIAGFFGLLVIAALLGRCGSGTPLATPASGSASSPSTASSRSSTPASTSSSAPEPANTLGRLSGGAQWDYSSDRDNMTGKMQAIATVESTNTVQFRFPYGGEQHATLSLRTHPRHGKDLILQIEKGQILCRSYEDCSVLIRFDDNKPETFSGVGAADHSTTSVFIRNYSRFYASMLKAKTVRISVPVYQEGAPIFEFEVVGFDAAKYK